MYMGIIRITPEILELLISKQQQDANEKSERIIIVSVIDGRLILTKRNCGSLYKTPFIVPYRCTPKYKNLKYVGMMDDRGKMLSKTQIKIYDGGENPRRVEEDLPMYWDVMLVDNEKEVDVRTVERDQMSLEEIIRTMRET